MWLLLFLFLARPIFAQKFTDLYTQYRTDYLYQRDQYQQNYSNYLNKKNIYLQYGTTATEKDKIDATKAVFLSRNSLLKDYLMALRVALNQNSNYSDNTTDIQTKLQDNEKWLDTQNQLIPDLNSSIALSNWVQTFKTHHVSIQTIANTALLQYQINLRLNTLDNIEKLANSAQIDWTDTYNNQSETIKSLFSEAYALTQQVQREDEFTDFYPEAKDYLNQSDIKLKNLISDLRSYLVKKGN
ncbi:MAG: hypothetical protein WC784_03475 [Candidatus Shapirobacteria bacterium]|jgi:hypothetical protein